MNTSIQKEISLQRTIGPFSQQLFQKFSASSLGVREKKNEGHRVILDLSRPLSLNGIDYIDKDTYSMRFCSVDDALKFLIQVGKGSFMGKLDIKHAFRLIPVSPYDWPLLDHFANGKYFSDIVLPLDVGQRLTRSA